MCVYVCERVSMCVAVSKWSPLYFCMTHTHNRPLAHLPKVSSLDLFAITLLYTAKEGKVSNRENL